MKDVVSDVESIVNVARAFNGKIPYNFSVVFNFHAVFNEERFGANPGGNDARGVFSLFFDTSESEVGISLSHFVF